MAEAADKLDRALRSDCAEDLCHVIADHNAKDFAALRKLLAKDADVEPVMRTRAIYALGRWQDTKAVADITRVLPDLDAAQLPTVIDALGRLGGANALKAILAHADDPSPDVRKFAVIALGRFDTAEAQAKLADIQAGDDVGYLRDLALKHIDRTKRSN